MTTTSLPEETLLKAKTELNEITGEKEEKIESLRHRIKDAQSRNEIPQRARLDDRMLVRFLRARKYDVEKATYLYSRYYQFR